MRRPDSNHRKGYTRALDKDSGNRSKLEESRRLCRIIPAENNHLLARGLPAATAHGVPDVHRLDVKPLERPTDVRKRCLRTV